LFNGGREMTKKNEEIHISMRERAAVCSMEEESFRKER